MVHHALLALVLRLGCLLLPPGPLLPVLSATDHAVPGPQAAVSCPGYGQNVPLTRPGPGCLDELPSLMDIFQLDAPTIKHPQESPPASAAAAWNKVM